MSKIMTIIPAALLCAISITLTSCDGCPGNSGESSESVISSTDPWSGAVYTEDAEIGAGAHTALITVTIDGKSVVITVKSDNDNLAEMLVDSGLVEGDEGEYGLYIKRVNGVLADYDADGAYWSLMQNGVPTAAGASAITIKDGDEYQLTLYS